MCPHPVVPWGWPAATSNNSLCAALSKCESGEGTLVALVEEKPEKPANTTGQAPHPRPELPDQHAGTPTPRLPAVSWQFWLEQYLYCDSYYSQISHIVSHDYFSFCINFDFPKG